LVDSLLLAAEPTPIPTKAAVTSEPSAISEATATTEPALTLPTEPTLAPPTEDPTAPLLSPTLSSSEPTATDSPPITNPNTTRSAGTKLNLLLSRFEIPQRDQLPSLTESSTTDSPSTASSETPNNNAAAVMEILQKILATPAAASKENQAPATTSTIPPNSHPDPTSSPTESPAIRRRPPIPVAPVPPSWPTTPLAEVNIRRGRGRPPRKSPSLGAQSNANPLAVVPRPSPLVPFGKSSNNPIVIPDATRGHIRRSFGSAPQYTAPLSTASLTARDQHSPATFVARIIIPRVDEVIAMDKLAIGLPPGISTNSPAPEISIDQLAQLVSLHQSLERSAEMMFARYRSVDSLAVQAAQLLEWVAHNQANFQRLGRIVVAPAPPPTSPHGFNPTLVPVFSQLSQTLHRQPQHPSAYPPPL